LNIQLFDFVLDNVSYVENNRSLESFLKGFGASRSPKSEPTSGAFHTHSEFRKTGSVWRRFGSFESPSEVASGDASSVLPDDNAARWCDVEFDLDFQLSVCPVQSLDCHPGAQETLERVVHKLSDRVPRLVAQMPSAQEGRTAAPDQRNGWHKNHSAHRNPDPAAARSAADLRLRRWWA
jgi:hypothetical protein